MWKLLCMPKLRRSLAAVVCLSFISFVCIQLKILSTSDHSHYMVDPYCINCGNKSNFNSKATTFQKLKGGLTQLNTIADYDERQPIKEFMGKVNFDMWKGTCMLSFNSLRQHPFFPSQPHVRSYLQIQDSLKINVNDKSFGLRVMGYIHPPVTGYYSFYLKSHFLSQFWLSTSNQENATKMAYTTRNKLNDFTFFLGKPKHKSERIFLEHGKKYYFEVLKILNDAIVGNNTGFSEIDWMLPRAKYFIAINGRYLSKYFDFNSPLYNNSRLISVDRLSPSLKFSSQEDEAISPNFPNFPLQNQAKSQLEKSKMIAIFGEQFDENLVFNQVIPYLEHHYIANAFSNCTYDPSYTRKRDFKRYEGVFYPYFPEVFPSDESNHVRYPIQKPNLVQYYEGNHVMSQAEAVAVVKTFMDMLNMKSPGNYRLISIINIEKINDREKGDRFFLELILRHHYDEKPLRVSEYVYRNKNRSRLCTLANFNWNFKVWINLILNVKSQPEWVMVFIENVAGILKETREDHLNIIIVDYGTKGMDIGEEMKRHGIKRYNIIKQPGVFQKTVSINKAASTIKDPNSIVLLMDLHLHLPQDFFDRIRKHTFQGYMAFAPILLRLDKCGRPKTKYLYPSGYWESFGFGIFGIYKSDWDNFGGMNTKEYTNRWGGEDWEMIDRVLSKGIEIIKLRLPGFYHFFHDKKGMWDNKDT